MSNLEDVIFRGTRAAQPAANTVAAGTLYFITDEGKIERSSGSAWETFSSASQLSTLSAGYALTLFGSSDEPESPISIPGPQGLTGPIGLTGPSGSGSGGFNGPLAIDGEDAEPILIPGLVGPQGLAGAGGSSDIILVRRVLTEAEIESINSSPITLVAAQGADKIIVPIFWSVELNLTVAYSSSPSMQIQYAGDTNNLLQNTILLSLTATLAKKYGFSDAVNTLVFGNYGAFDPRNKAVQLIGTANPGTPGTGVVTGVSNLVYAVITTT